jgi:enterochelin esterase-like enzyme
MEDKNNNEIAENKAEIFINNVKIEVSCPPNVYESRENVAYGTVKHETYFSKTTGLERGYNILLPADYSEEKQYPVLYMLHGIFWDEYTLINDKNHRIVEIMGNLATDKKAKEMIVVFPNMFAKTDKDQMPAFTDEGIAPYDNFMNDLVNDLIPYINDNYSTLTDRENQAVIGFSMGGRESLFIGFQRPDLFAYIGAISPAPGLTPGKDYAMSHPGQMQENNLKFANANIPYLLLLCCGTQDSVVGQFPKSYHNIMVKNETVHVWYEVLGADHDAQAIRSGLSNFASSIFK